ncbi:aspartate aminotransferase family protein [Treponema pectinovorum]|uniref:aspartate aminotransferase family protein n=1 Tax=Treponema pectinovorum TaxID=164 RepID=UPI0011F0B5B9|nr:acetylornithine/succinylornithine family transaminase [Treponema pectinovorum]
MGSKNVVNNYGSFDVTFAYGKGSTCYDVNGKKYIDFLAGIAVNSFGHNFKPLVKAVQKQLKRQIHTCNYFTSDVGLEYADSLLKASGFSGIYFGNSGAEANEAAFKLARKYGFLTGGEKRKTIYTLESSFHGRTLATLTATGQKKFHPECFAPYAPGFKTIKANDYQAIKTAFDDTTAALMIECIQGEGGVNLVDSEWAKQAAHEARKAGALVMVDEVQTGFGRTGTLFASDWLGFEPDVVSFAKGVAGGIPMGGILFRGKAAEVFKAGDHQSTFAGNPLACSAALVVLKELLKDGFMQSVEQKGEYIKKAIKSWNSKFVKEVRGKGLLLGIDIDETKSAVELETKLLQNGLLTSTAGKNTLRLVPPLNISQKEIDSGLEILKQTLLQF